MTDTTSMKYTFEPLKGPENYFSWQIQEQDVLTDLDLLEYPLGTKTWPTDPTLAADWVKKDRKALSAIRLRCSSAVVPHIMGCATSKEAWDTLKNIFATQGVMSKVTATRKLQRYKIEEGANMEEEIRKLMKLKEEITLMGGTLTDEDFTYNLLSALPLSWDAFIASAQGTTKSSEVIGHIMQEDARRADRNSTSTTLLVKGNSSNQKKPKKKSKFRKGVFCHACGKEGHIRPECRSSGNQKSGSTGGKPRHSAHVVELDDNDGYAFVAHMTPNDLPVKGEIWLGDTATQNHIVRDRSAFATYTETPGSTITGAGACAALSRGNVRVSLITKAGTVPVTLTDVLHAPSLEYNLLSLGRLSSGGLHFVGKGDELHIMDGTRNIGFGRKSGNLYHMAVKTIAPDPSHASSALAVHTTRTWYEWHCALGHINKGQLREMHKLNLVDGLSVDIASDPDFECETCIQAKHARAPFPEIATTKIHQLGDLIFSDIWGPAQIESLQGNRYIISFTDAGSRYVVIYFMKSRDAALDRFKHFAKLLETQVGRRIKVINVDNTKEYTEGQFKAHLSSQGIVLRTTAPYSPAQNGIAERLNRTLAERARAMLLAHNSPKFLWQEAFSYACFLKNRTPTRALRGTTPYELFWGKCPDLQDAQEFGIPCWVLVPSNRRTGKLDAKSEKYVFTGISDHSAGWRYYTPGMRQILVSRDIIFQRQHTAIPETIDSTLDGTLRLEGEKSTAPATSPGITPSKPESATPAGTKSSSTSSPTASSTPGTRTSTRTIPRIDYKQLHQTGKLAPKSDQPAGAQAHLCFAAIDFDHPRTLEEVQARDDWPEWKKAMDAEMAQLTNRETFKLAELPEGRKAVGCRWVFAIKRDTDSSIIKYKARLVAQGFSQIPGQDYYATYAPVVRLESFRACTAIATEQDLDDDSIDYEGAYLNGTLTETIYMRQAPGYDDGTGRVYIMLKAIYGLKQAGQVWNDLLNHVLTNLLGFTRSQADPCVYYKPANKLTMALLHVDDTTLYGERKRLDELKTDISQHFAITASGGLRNFVGLQVDRNRAARTLKIHQARYLQTILERFGMADCNAVSTPLDPNIKLVPLPENEAPADVPYAAAVGSLMYAAVGTRPDIAFAVQTLSQFSSRPSNTHWTAVKHVFRYLKGTTDVGITYSGNTNLELIGFSDADWAQSQADRRSVSGYAFKLADGTVSWSSKKQPTVALSTMEAEYIALSHAAKEAIWLRRLLTELGVISDSPTLVLTDNQSAIAFAHDNQFHARSKHIDIRHHFIRERIDSGDIEVRHCASEDNCADMLTKALAKPTHSRQLALANMAAR